VISVSLAVDQRGKGYGSQAIQLASEDILSRTKVASIHAYIKPGNLSSIQAFTRAGFLDSGAVEVRGNLARKYTMQRSTQNQ
jgi:RimJ/RimL family protein N-acetyltransferase